MPVPRDVQVFILDVDEPILVPKGSELMVTFSVVNEEEGIEKVVVRDTVAAFPVTAQLVRQLFVPPEETG